MAATQRDCGQCNRIMLSSKLHHVRDRGEMIWKQVCGAGKTPTSLSGPVVV